MQIVEECQGDKTIIKQYYTLINPFQSLIVNYEYMMLDHVKQYVI
jgi:hypothetical protein